MMKKKVKPSDSERIKQKTKFRRVPQGFADKIKEQRILSRNYDHFDFHRHISAPLTEDLGTRTCKICSIHYFSSEMVSIG